MSDLLADIERAEWKRRLWDAARDGVELAGPEAVAGVFKAIAAELGIKGKGGRKHGALTPAQLKAVRYAAKEYQMMTPAEIAVGKKFVDDKTLAGIARMHPQNFGREFAWGSGKRWIEFWGAFMTKIDE